jgi:hypothetical protein
MRHKLPVAFKLSWYWLERTFGADAANKHSSQLFATYADSVSYSYSMLLRKAFVYDVSCIAASREWFSLIRTAVLDFVAKLGVRFLKPSDSDADTNILELDMHGCITTTLNYVLDSLKAEYAKRSASNEELNIKMKKKVSSGVINCSEHCLRLDLSHWEGSTNRWHGTSAQHQRLN